MDILHLNFWSRSFFPHLQQILKLQSSQEGIHSPRIPVDASALIELNQFLMKYLVASE